jgi:hypothetical protein
MRQKAKDNDAESFHVKLSCDELKFLLLRGSKCMKSKGKATSSDSLEKMKSFDTIF